MEFMVSHAKAFAESGQTSLFFEYDAETILLSLYTLQDGEDSSRYARLCNP